MTSNHFFIPRDALEGARAVLRGKEHHHLGRVLRARRGETVWLFDEDGRRYRAEIDLLSSQETRLSILEELPAPEVRTRIILAPAVLKAGTMDEVILKASELGAFRISPVICERSVSRPDGREDRKVERWSRIARTASKQSRSGRSPSIDTPASLPAFLAACRSELKFVLNEHRGERLNEALRGVSRAPDEAAVLIGPEGGWSEAEEASFAGAGFASIRLGGTILRAETAAAAVLAVLDNAWNW